MGYIGRNRNKSPYTHWVPEGQPGLFLGGGGGVLTSAVGIGHGEGVVLCSVQEGECGLAIQES